MASGRFHLTHTSDAERGPGAHGNVIGRYILHSRIAAGGMASVYLGSLMGAADFSRLVAIKRMHPQYAADREFTQRFRSEAWLNSRLTHPNIVQTLDVVEWGEELLLVMEYVHGVTLKALCTDAKAAGERLPCGISAGIMVQVLHGLHAAHVATDDDGQTLGIVHRDFSPQNIIIGRDGQAKVLDFGIARAKADAPITAVGQVAGKYGYLAPEQINTKEVDQRTDIFAAGSVCWEILTGERLFRAPNLSDASVMSMVLTKRVPPPSRFNASVPPAVDEVVLRALNREPAARYATARDMALALEMALPTASQSSIGACLMELSADRLAQLTRMLARTRRTASLVRRELATRTAVATNPGEQEKTVVSAPVHDSLIPPRPQRAPIVRWLATLALLLLVMGTWMWPRSRGHDRARLSERIERSHPSSRPVQTPPTPTPPTPLSGQSSSMPTTAGLASNQAPSTAMPLATKPDASHAAPMTRTRSSRTSIPTRNPSTSRSSLASSATVIRPNCDPPTYLDAQGIRRFKEGCL